MSCLGALSLLGVALFNLFLNHLQKALSAITSAPPHTLICPATFRNPRHLRGGHLCHFEGFPRAAYTVVLGLHQGERQDLLAEKAEPGVTVERHFNSALTIARRHLRGLALPGVCV